MGLKPSHSTLNCGDAFEDGDGLFRDGGVAQGQLYSWGSGRSGQLGHGDTQTLVLPRLVEALNGLVVTNVACGSAHTAVVTKAGEVWTWGWGHFGQLGIGSNKNAVTPCRVTALQGVRVILAACGSAHTAVTSDNGHTYTWGWGVNGQLGHGDDATVNVPTVVKKLENVYASHIACGLAHTVRRIPYP
jgi:RCC1 and BTB domain-containing protein